MPTFEIVCLANSRKRQGRCVAGLRVDGKGWLRPVGSNAEGVLHPHHYTLPDDTEPQLGDVLRVHCSRPNPRPYHPEDWVVMSLPWERVADGLGRNKYDWLRPYLSSDPLLLGSPGERVALARLQAHPVARSLSLIAPQNIKWHIALNKEGERRIRVDFTLNGGHYSLPLTDPVWEQRLLHLKAGVYERETARIDADAEVWLTVSLSEPFAPAEQDAEFCYKLVVGVLVLTPTAGLVEDKSENGTIGRQNKSTAKPRRSTIDTPAPTYAGAPDLTDYPDPFAEDAPAVAAVTEGHSNVAAIALPALTGRPLVDTPPLPKKTRRGENGVPEDEAKELKSKNRREKKRDGETDIKIPGKENERANGKWDNKQDQLLWERQIARRLHNTVSPPSEDWSPDEDALLLRLAADGETSGEIAVQLGRGLEAIQARLEMLLSGSGAYQ